MEPHEHSRSYLTVFWRDDTGALSVELVVWVWFLSLWSTLMLGAFYAFDNRADAAKATYAMADVAARFRSYDPNDDGAPEIINLIDFSFNQIMPGAAAGSTMRISSIRFEDDPVNPSHVVQWTQCFNGTRNDLNFAALQDTDIPNYSGTLPLMQDRDTVLLVETRAPYQAIGGTTFGWTEFTWRHAIAHRPRHNTEIPPPFGANNTVGSTC